MYPLQQHLRVGRRYPEGLSRLRLEEVHVRAKNAAGAGSFRAFSGADHNQGHGREGTTQEIGDRANSNREDHLLCPDPDPSPQISAPHQAKVESSRERIELQAKKKPLESIKITAPGTYELNLPSLFERDELIMAVKEGTYFIDLTSAFKKSKKD